jgi:hypothetical protein
MFANQKGKNFWIPNFAEVSHLIARSAAIIADATEKELPASGVYGGGQPGS